MEEKKKKMRRRGRGGGIAAIRARQEARKQYQQTGQKMGGEQLSHVKEQMAVFKDKLEVFARRHRSAIRKDPEFRRQFQVMCARIGVDPLASNKGFWAEILGVGRFYTELSIQVVDVCMSTRSVNGGLIDMPSLLSRLQALRGSNSVDVSVNDIEQAVGKLRVFGSGYSVVKAGRRLMVMSVPVELNPDHSELFKLVEQRGVPYYSARWLSEEHGWSPARTARATDLLLEEGMCWEDRRGVGEDVLYWIPSLEAQSA